VTIFASSVDYRRLAEGQIEEPLRQYIVYGLSEEVARIGYSAGVSANTMALLLIQPLSAEELSNLLGEPPP
jgi:hypothetical protein